MAETRHPPHPILRSVLYMPASNARAMDKARGLACDGVVFDLEDAVAPGAKHQARAAAVEATLAGGYGKRTLVIRVNRPETKWGADDIAAVAKSRAHAVLLPKVRSVQDVQEFASALVAAGAPDGLALWLMVETPAAVRDINAIAAAHPRLGALILGLEDLAKDMRLARARVAGDRRALHYTFSRCILAARASGLAVLDGVYPKFQDLTGFDAECAEGRAFGFDGKTLIHPCQIDGANRAFGPSADDVVQARRILSAFELARNEGQGLAVLDGEMIEALHVEAARRIIAVADTVAATPEADV